MASINRTLEAIATDWGPKFLAALEQARQNYHWMIPPNWRALDIDQTFQVAKLMREEGLALAWAPSAHVLERLLAAPDLDERKAVLMEHEGQVLADLDRALTEWNASR